MERHPFNIYPEMSDIEFEQLKTDLEANGFDTSQSVVIYESKILDGWNRYRACQELNIAYTERVFFGSPIEAISFVARTNNRRHLNESQRAMLAVELQKLMGQYGTKTQICGLKEAADMVNVSERSAQSANIVSKRGVPELAEKVKQGDLAVSTAVEIANLPKPKQNEIMQEIKDMPRKDIKATIQHIADNKPVDQNTHDDFTNLAMNYGSGLLSRIRNLQEYLEKAEEAFKVRGMYLPAFAPKLSEFDYSALLAETVKLRNLEKCGYCLARGCDQCTDGYIIKESK